MPGQSDRYRSEQVDHIQVTGDPAPAHVQVFRKGFCNRGAATRSFDITSEVKRLLRKKPSISMLRRINNSKASRWRLGLAGLLLSAAIMQGQGARSEAMVKIDGIGLVPAKIVLACEQATGDGGHEAFFDAEWDYFSDCVNDELYRRRKK